MLCQTLSHTLKLAPHERPSTQPLTKNPQQLCYFLCQTLTKDPQQVWQTLKNFDYPIIEHSVSSIQNLFYYISFRFRCIIQAIIILFSHCPYDVRITNQRHITHFLCFLHAAFCKTRLWKQIIVQFGIMNWLPGFFFSIRGFLLYNTKIYQILKIIWSYICILV